MSSTEPMRFFTRLPTSCARTAVCRTAVRPVFPAASNSFSRAFRAWVAVLAAVRCASAATFLTSSSAFCAGAVARAWSDAAFRERLLSDATAAIDEIGYLGNATGHLKALENTAKVHNLVVCTLCSCYPFSILGIAPN